MHGRCGCRAAQASMRRRCRGHRAGPAARCRPCRSRASRSANWRVAHRPSLIGPSANAPDRLQLAVKQFDQIGAADRVDQHIAMADRPPLDVHAVAMAADLQPDHPRTKGLEQHLGIAWVIAEIGHDQRIAVVSAVDRRQRAGARAAKSPCGSSSSSPIPSTVVRTACCRRPRRSSGRGCGRHHGR